MKKSSISPIRRILVPTDFSGNAKNALYYALEIAKMMNSKIVLYHVTQIPVTASPETFNTVSMEEFEKISKRSLEKLTKEVAVKFPTVDIETFTDSGFTVEGIKDLSASQKIDLIIMGTKGRHGLGEFVIGTNAAEVIEKAKCPVITVPENASFSIPGKILFATNFYDNDFQTLYLLSEKFKICKPEIVILHISGDNPMHDEKTMMDWYQGQVLTNIPYDNFSFHVINDKNVEQALHDYIVKNNVDMVAMSTHKRNFFQKLFNRSLTKKMVYHTHIPLLAFHVHDKIENEQA